MKCWYLGIAFLVVAGLASQAASPAGAQDEAAMDNARLETLIGEIEGLDGEIEGRPGFWQFSFQGYQTYVITDERADRMRIMVPVAPAESLSPEVLLRVMQANFDSALDARYAVAQGALWSAFIHPLSPLDDAEFRSGFLQVVTLAATYGTSYSSSGLRFGGGDAPPESDGAPDGEDEGQAL